MISIKVRTALWKQIRKMGKKVVFSTHCQELEELWLSPLVELMERDYNMVRQSYGSARPVYEVDLCRKCYFKHDDGENESFRRGQKLLARGTFPCGGAFSGSITWSVYKRDKSDD